MLDVEICQRLKKAGFPQGETPEFPPPKKSDDVCTNFDNVWKHENGEWVLLVRIEDLLRELTNDNPWELNLNAEWQNLFPGGEYSWTASVKEADATGLTPELALANLYLSLHQAHNTPAK